MDSLRKQLDALMGANRNGDVTEVTRKYYDRDVCRLYLAGLCPHELFQLTKMDLGPCPKLHSLPLRKDYQEAKAKGKDNYDRELEDALERLVVECERKITRSLRRLEADDAKAATAISVSQVTKSPEVDELTKQIREKLKEVDVLDLEGRSDDKIRVIEQVDELRAKRADKQATLLLQAFDKHRVSMPPQPMQSAPPVPPVPPPVDARTQEMIMEKLKKAEELGELGMVDEAQKLMEEAEALKKLGAPQDGAAGTPESSKIAAVNVRITDQKLRVCDVCGCFLSIYDTDQRLADHFGGKLHSGYMQIRDVLNELREERNRARKVVVDERLRERASSRDRDRDRDRERRDRDRDQEVRETDRDRGRRSRERDPRSRDRERERDRDRHREKEREREREREREKESSEDYRRHKRDRSRSRSPSRERSRDRKAHRSDYHRRHDRYA
uniref:Uncharacterized protein n=1 Tax=Araucaria cunninghamii TaxID=56994 RepID=A0A0D6QY87_ARACU